MASTGSGSKRVQIPSELAEGSETPGDGPGGVQLPATSGGAAGGEGERKEDEEREGGKDNKKMDQVLGIAIPRGSRTRRTLVVGEEGEGRFLGSKVRGNPLSIHDGPSGGPAAGEEGEGRSLSPKSSSGSGSNSSSSRGSDPDWEVGKGEGKGKAVLVEMRRRSTRDSGIKNQGGQLAGAACGRSQGSNFSGSSKSKPLSSIRKSARTLVQLAPGAREQPGLGRTGGSKRGPPRSRTCDNPSTSRGGDNVDNSNANVNLEHMQKILIAGPGSGGLGVDKRCAFGVYEQFLNKSDSNDSSGIIMIRGCRYQVVLAEMLKAKSSLSKMAESSFIFLVFMHYDLPNLEDMWEWLRTVRDQNVREPLLIGLGCTGTEYNPITRAFAKEGNCLKIGFQKLCKDLKQRYIGRYSENPNMISLSGGLIDYSSVATNVWKSIADFVAEQVVEQVVEQL